VLLLLQSQVIGYVIVSGIIIIYCMSKERLCSFTVAAEDPQNKSEQGIMFICVFKSSDFLNKL
jgi:hypothetical protein